DPPHDAAIDASARASAALRRIRAVCAGAVQHDLVAGDRIAGSAFDLVQGPLELGVLERLDLAAAVADEVMVVLASWMRRFVPGRVGADVDPLDEAIGRQLVERPVDGGDADLAAIGAKRVEDLLRGQAAVLPPQQLDHRAATAALAAPGEGQSPL